MSDLGDPAVRRWAFGVMAQSIEEGVSDSEFNRRVEDAIRDPDLIHPSEASSIIDKFHVIYSKLELAGKLGDLSIESQQFASSVSRFSGSVSEFHRMRRSQDRWATSFSDLQTPGMTLDVGEAVREVTELISEVAGRVDGEFSRLHLEDILHLAEDTQKIGANDPTQAWRVLSLIKERLDVIVGVLSNNENLVSVASRVVEEVRRISSGGEFKGDLKKIEQLGQTISLNIRANNFDYGMHELVLEGMLRLLEGNVKSSIFHLRKKAGLLKYDIATAMNNRWNWDLQPELVQYGDLYRSTLMMLDEDRNARIDKIVRDANDPEIDPIYNDSVELVSTYLELGEPFGALSAIKGMQFPLRYGNAIMLEAVYRHRLGGENPKFINRVRPEIIKAFLGDYLPARDVDDELGDASSMEHRLGFLVDVSRRTNRPIHLEFGGGMTPGIVKTAKEDPNSISISIDPAAQFVFSGGMNFIPTSNFIMLRGRAEEAALLGGGAPYADSVLIVAPQPFNIHSLLLSALIVTKPGGRIDVYSSDSLELYVLDRLGLEYTTSEFKWDNDVNPPTLNIRHNAQTTHIKIIVPEFGSMPVHSSADASEPVNAPNNDLESRNFAGFFDPGIQEEGARMMLDAEDDENPVDVLSANVLTRISTSSAVMPAATASVAASATPKIVK